MTDAERAAQLARIFSRRLGFPAKELTSAAWEGLQRAKVTFDPAHPSGASFSTYSSSKARWWMLEYAKRQRRSQSRAPALLEDVFASTDWQTGRFAANACAAVDRPRVDAAESCDAALSLLRPAERDAFTLFAQGASYAEIVKARMSTRNRVSWLLRSARRKLGV